MSWNRPVFSKMLSEVGYDSDSKELLVVFAKGGKRGIYSGVPEELAEQLANAPSAGSMLHQEIIPYYKFRQG